MDIKTKFKTGDKVWFYNLGQIHQAKIIHIDIDINGESNVTYTLDRKDKQYKDARYDRLYYRANCINCFQQESADETCFEEDGLASNKKELINILIEKELNRHNNALKNIKNL